MDILAILADSFRQRWSYIDVHYLSGLICLMYRNVEIATVYLNYNRTILIRLKYYDFFKSDNVQHYDIHDPDSITEIEKSIDDHLKFYLRLNK